MNARLVGLTTLLLSAAAAALGQTPLGTEFTYQGLLTDAGSPADGLHDLRFRLYDALSDGMQVGPTVCVDNVTVTDGLFTAPVDFGAQFAGQKRFLEVDVRADTGLDCADPAGFITLSPRQELTATPHALLAQTTSLPLSLSGTAAGHVILGENSSTAIQSSGVYGRSSALSGVTYGGRFESTSSSGIGVYAESPGTAGDFYAGGPSGIGVRGIAGSGGGTGYGGVFYSHSFDDGYGLHSTSNGTAGRGVYGAAVSATGTNYGGYFESASTAGRGVYGSATNATGTTYGGYFQSASTSGYGVYATSNGPYGVWSQSNGTGGRGVYGSGAFGVWGTSASTSGTGVVGWATAGTGVTYGVYGESDSTSGTGVNGFATAASGTTYGGYFESASTSATGVFGKATAGTGTTYGVYGQSASTSGKGVQGHATAGSGTTYGGYFASDSTSGIGVLASGRTGVFAQSSHTAVDGQAFAESGITFGGSFDSASTDGTGVRARAIAVSGTTIGMHGVSASPTGYGVYSVGDLHTTGDFTAAGSKAGYVTDFVRNGGSEPLECGDVVEISGHEQAIVGDIPVIVVRRAKTANSRAVLGPVDCAVLLTPKEEREEEANLPARLRYATPQFHAHKTEGPIEPGGYGRVVTLGSFKAIRADASFGAIQPGDLLVSSGHPGYAMRADDPKTGTVIGKALGTLSDGASQIPVLVQSR